MYICVFGTRSIVCEIESSILGSRGIGACEFLDSVWERSREEFSHRRAAAAARQPERAESIMTSPLQRWGLWLRSVARRRAPCKVGWDSVTSLWCTQVAHHILAPLTNPQFWFILSIRIYRVCTDSILIWLFFLINLC